MERPIKGTCKDMCPYDEIILRESQHILHFLEMVPGTETQLKPKADRKRVLKMYTRSAAGTDISLPKNLRTTEALLKSVNYLLEEVINLKTLSWHHIYDFIADRLLAVRQDMVIQMLPNSHCISLLQPIIRFYTYSAYKLCEHPLSQFDPVLNNMHLQECLKKLLILYDDCEYFSRHCLCTKNINIEEYESVYSDSRPFFEALYIIFNLGDVSAIFRGLSLLRKWRTEIVEQSLQISITVLKGNWYRACVLMKELPSLLAAIAAIHLPVIRRDALRKMVLAYNSKNLTYPVDVLQYQLLYNDKTDVINDCKYYNIVVENGAIKFMKNSIQFKEDIPKPKHEKFVQDKLSGRNITNLVLFGEI